MKIIYALSLVLVLPLHASASCWVAGNFKGMATSVDESYAGVTPYKYFPDGISSQYFSIDTNMDNASVKPGDLTYAAIDQQTVIGVSSSNGQTNVETWIISADKKHIYFTQTRSGFGSFDGTKSFVGNIVGPCK